MAVRFIHFLTLRLFLLFSLVAVPSGAVEIKFSSSVENFEFSAQEKALIQEISDGAELEVRKLLPSLDDDLVLEVVASPYVIPQTGELGGALSAGRVKWSVDPTREGGVAQTATTYLRGTLFHEFHHLARGYVFSRSEQDKSLLEAAVNEGLGTVFARDFAGSKVPWANYPPSVREWVSEIQGVKGFEQHDHWMYQHSDGRSWVGYMVGTYLVDQAMKATGKTSVDLLLTPTEDIIRFGLSTSSPD